MRYIDKDVLIEKIEETTWYHISPVGELAEGANGKTDVPLYKAEDIRAVVADMPVIEIVRCKDCKWYGDELSGGKHSCENFQLPYCLENDFCSYGERNENKSNKPVEEMAKNICRVGEAAEVAKEIFDDIERVMFATRIGTAGGLYYTTDLKDCIADLKKKYTESE